MCLITIAYNMSARYPLIVAANRDERHSRATTVARWWHDQADVLAGRDLVAGGSWLGINRRGRLAAVTNIFEPDARQQAAQSRGHLVSQFLTGSEPLEDYRGSVEATGDNYAAYNLLLFEPAQLLATSNRSATRNGPTPTSAPNRGGTSKSLTPGVHVYSNNPATEDWPKLGQARRAVEALMGPDNPTEDLLNLLRQQTAAAAAPPSESIFVVGPEFGTRCSTVILVGHEHAQLIERSFDPQGQTTETHRYFFELSESS